MDRDYWQVLREIVTEVKLQIERDPTNRRLLSSSPSGRPDLMHVLLKLERTRILVNNLRHYSAYKDDLLREAEISKVELDEIIDTLAEIVRDDAFRLYAGARPFDVRRLRSFPIRRTPIDVSVSFPGVTSAHNLVMVIEGLIQSLSTKFEGSGTNDFGEGATRDLKRLVPAQKLAPIEVRIVQNRLQLIHRNADPKPQDKSNVEAAAAALYESGKRVIEELGKSNCDKRLLETFEQLQNQLAAKGNIIQLGLTNLTCEVMSQKFQEEIATATASLVQSHCKGIQLYLAQFDEWNRFIENAGAANLTSDDIASLAGNVHTLVNGLKSDAHLVDPEVPATLQRLAELVKTPGKAGKRAAYAIVRSIENIVGRIYEHATDFLDKTAGKMVESLSTSASKLAISGLIVLALGGAGVLAPVSGSLSELQWVAKATRIIEEQFKGLMVP